MKYLPEKTVNPRNPRLGESQSVFLIAIVT
jgi:hypothetical protein